MAFFRNICFLYSFFIAAAGLMAASPLCLARTPDHVLAQAILKNKPGWKVRLIYGHGAAVSHEVGEISLWKKGSCGDPYFISLAQLSDDVLYDKVKNAEADLSVPFMRIKAFMLWHGRGTKRNKSRAVQLWRIAAAAGDETSTDLLSRLPRTPHEAVFRKRYLAMKKSRLEDLSYGKELFIPQIYFEPVKDISMVQLGKTEQVSAFLERIVLLWKQGGEVRVLLAPED